MLARPAGPPTRPAVRPTRPAFRPTPLRQYANRGQDREHDARLDALQMMSFLDNEVGRQTRIHRTHALDNQDLLLEHFTPIQSLAAMRSIGENIQQSMAQRIPAYGQVHMCNRRKTIAQTQPLMRNRI